MDAAARPVGSTAEDRHVTRNAVGVTLAAGAIAVACVVLAEVLGRFEAALGVIFLATAVVAFLAIGFACGFLSAVAGVALVLAAGAVAIDLLTFVVFSYCDTHECDPATPASFALMFLPIPLLLVGVGSLRARSSGGEQRHSRTGTTAVAELHRLLQFARGISSPARVIALPSPLMRSWSCRAFYVLPAAICAVTLLVFVVFSLSGADCGGGDLLDGAPPTCNRLGELQHDFGWAGFVLALITVPFWAIGMLVAGVRLLRSRRRAS
jgi:hypothetical protein